MYVDTSIFTKSIDREGETVTLEVYSNQSYSDYGDKLSQTTSYYGVKAIFNTYGIKQNFVQEGQFNLTNYSFFFKAEQPGVVTDNVVVRSDGTRWKINKAVNHMVEGRSVVNEAAVTNS